MEPQESSRRDKIGTKGTATLQGPLLLHESNLAPGRPAFGCITVAGCYSLLWLTRFIASFASARGFCRCGPRVEARQPRLMAVLPSRDSHMRVSLGSSDPARLFVGRAHMALF